MCVSVPIQSGGSKQGEKITITRTTTETHKNESVYIIIDMPYNFVAGINSHLKFDIGSGRIDENKQIRI